MATTRFRGPVIQGKFNEAGQTGYNLENKAANYSVVIGDSGKTFTCNTDGVTFTLPAVAANEGSTFTFVNTAADGGSEHYIDFEKIKKVDGYKYYRFLTDLFEPDQDGDFSYVSYMQGDCKLSKIMVLSEFYYKQPMGVGKVTTNTVKNPKWIYPAPNSMNEYMLELVCNYLK